MQVRFCGTRGSLPVPGPTTLRYGGNTSCIEIRSFFKPLFLPGFKCDIYAPRGLAGSLRETLCGSDPVIHKEITPGDECAIWPHEQGADVSNLVRSSSTRGG